MDMLILIAIVFAVAYVIHTLRGNALGKAAAALNLKAHDGALLSERAEIEGFAKQIGKWHVSGWGHGVRGVRSGTPLLLQEVELSRTIGFGKNRSVHWFTLVHWRLTGTDLPRFRLAKPGSALPGVLVSGPIVQAAKDALGMHAEDTLYAPVPALTADPAFAAKWTAMGEDAEAVTGFFDPARRRAVLDLPKCDAMAGLGGDLLCLLPGRIDASELKRLVEQVDAQRDAFTRTASS